MLLIHKKLPHRKGKPVRQILFWVRSGFFLSATYHKETDEQGDDIKSDGEIQHGLITGGVNHIAVSVVRKGTYMVHDKGCNLVSGETGDGPRGEGDTVDCTDVLHSVMVGQQCGNVAEAAAPCREKGRAKGAAPAAEE